MIQAPVSRSSPELVALRRALAEAQAERDQLQTVVANLAGGVVIADMAGNLLHWNPAALRLHGFDSLDEVRQNLSTFTTRFELRIPHGRPIPLEQWPLMKLLRGEAVENYELEVERLDTRQTWIINYSGMQIPAVTNHASLVLLNLHDVTETRRAAAARQESETKLRAVVETAVDGIITFNSSGTIDSVNPAATIEFEYSSFELLGQQIQTLIPSLFAPVPIDRLLGSGREMIGRRRSGKEFPIELSLGKMDVGGNTHYTAIIGDITKRKDSELRLQNKQVLLRTLIEAINDPVYIKDVSGKFMFVNNALAKLAGVTVEACIGVHARDVFEPNVAQVSEESDQRTLETPTTHTYEAAVRIKNKDHNFLITKCRFHNADGSIGGLCGISRDITDLKQAQRQSMDNQAQLAHLERLQTVGQMASGLAHELNQPLGAIVNYAGAAKYMLSLGKQQLGSLETSLEKIVGEALRAGEIIRRLRSFVQKQHPQVTPLDVNALVQESLGILAFQLRQANVKIQTDLSGQLPKIRVDPIQFSQVMVNLLRNAQDAMQEQPPSERCLHVTSKLLAQDRVEVSVSDNGPGVPEENLIKLFDAFYTTKASGMGIGLSLCRTIIENHGGEICAERNATRGMRFRIIIPTFQDLNPKEGSQ